MARTTLRLAFVGAALSAVIGSFAYLGGWLTPQALTPARFVDGFEQVAGVHPGFRRNHAKGVGVAGHFDSNGDGVRLSTAAVFRPGRLPVIGRFSLGGGQPYAADVPDAVRGLGLQFSLPDGEVWRTAMVSLPVFPVNSPEAFYEMLIASKPEPGTNKPDPARMTAFLARHPETAQALGVIKSQPPASGFENTTFRGLNAFRFIDAAGASTPVRWMLIPLQPFEQADPAAAARDRNVLFDGLIAAIHRQPPRWRLVVIIGHPGDPTHDPSIAWPAGREQVELGLLTLDSVESDETSAATDLNFDPLVLPAGIAPSDDPILSARSAVYAQSFTRRAGEAKPQPAITSAHVRKGQ